MNQNPILQSQAERMHRLTKEVLRKYQMRDRNEITCCGVSVSQCYTLDLLGENGEMTMAALAKNLFLDKSTVTRVVDQLIKRGFAIRQYSDHDRREVRVSLTDAGKKLREEILSSLLESQRLILEQIPETKRESILEALELISTAVHGWLATCCVPNKVEMIQPLKIQNKERNTS